MLSTYRPEPVAQYRPGESFACTKRQFSPDTADGLAEPCGAVIVMHGYHWCMQVCPRCLANYHVGSGTDSGVYPDHGFYPPETAARVRATIAANGGQYVPQFR